VVPIGIFKLVTKGERDDMEFRKKAPAGEHKDGARIADGEDEKRSPPQHGRGYP